MLAEASIDHVQNRPARHRSLSRALSDAGGRGHRSLLRREPHPAPRQRRPRSSAKVTCVLGRNGVGKTSLLRAIFGLQPIRARPHPVGRQGHHRACRRMSARARGLALVPQGREIFPRLTVQENLETGFAPLPREQRRMPDEIFELFPVLKRHAAPARRRSLGRPAAAAGDRPRAGDAAAPAGPGRADRGHPALDHQGHRAGDPRPAPRAATWRSCWSSSISISRATLADRYRGDGPRRGRAVRRSRATWSRAMSVATLRYERSGAAAAPRPAARSARRRRGRDRLRAARRRDACSRISISARPAGCCFPTADAGEPPLAVLLNTSGGLAGGDRDRASPVAVEPARAATRHHAGGGEDLSLARPGYAASTSTLAVGAGAWLEWLPQETILFDGARLAAAPPSRWRRDGRLAGRGDAGVRPRRARRDAVAHGRAARSLADQRGGRLAWDDALALDGDDRGTARRSRRLRRRRGARDRALCRRRCRTPVAAGARARRDGAAAAARRWSNGVLVARFLGAPAHGVRADLARYLARAAARGAGLPARLPRVWQC